MSEAKVSIVLPAFNAEKYLGKAIKSILNQSHKNLEFIILNDGSTDNTENIILNFKDSRILYIKNPSNLGLIKTLNNGFAMASGDYVARMDADDIAHPDRLKIQLEFLEGLKKPAIVGSNIIIINCHDEIIKIPRKVHLYEEENFWIKFRKTPLHHPTVMMSREIASRFSPFYNANDVHMEDYAAWFRVNAEYPIYNIEQPLLFYRVHDSNITKVHNQAQTSNMINFLKNFYLDALGEKARLDSIRSVLFLNIVSAETPERVYNDILANGTLFVEKFGHKDIVDSDNAYTIFNIALKTSWRYLSNASLFIVKHIGVVSLVNAMMSTSNEAFRSIFLKLFYKLKYNALLKENI